MGRDRLVQTGPAAGLVAGLLDGLAANVAAGQQAREQPLARGAGAPPVVAQDLQQARREHHVAVLAALALRDAHDHALRIDVARAQADGFRNAQAGGVAGRQDGAVLGGGDAVEEADHLPGAGHDRQLAGLLGGGQDLGQLPVLAQGDAVEEAQRGNRDTDRAGRELLLGGEEDVVGTDLLRAQPVRGLAEMAREQRDLVEVGVLGAGRQIADLHILRHATAKGCHGKPPWRLRMG